MRYLPLVLLIILSVTGCSSKGGPDDPVDEARPDAGAKTFPVKGDNPKELLYWCVSQADDLRAAIEDRNEIAVERTRKDLLVRLRKLEGLLVRWVLDVDQIKTKYVSFRKFTTKEGPFTYSLTPGATVWYDLARPEDVELVGDLTSTSRRVMLVAVIEKVGMSGQREKESDFYFAFSEWRLEKVKP